MFWEQSLRLCILVIENKGGECFQKEKIVKNHMLHLGYKEYWKIYNALDS